MLKPCVAWFFAVASAQDTGFMRTLFVEYVDGTSDGHFQFGKSIGEAMGPDIQAVWAGDLQLHAMETWVLGEGREIFEGLVSETNATYPLYMREVEGMADGSGIALQRLLVNQLREELAQWVEPRKREGHCTDGYVVNAQLTALGHNDDWPINWRKSSYFVIATALDADGRAKFRMGSWCYPGLLFGGQLNWNSYGMVWTVNSLFPRSFRSRGVGTAWVSRHMTEAKSLQELVSRASNKRVTTALNYNVGLLNEKELWNLEVTTGGLHTMQKITGPYVHANQFKLLNVSQFPEPSSVHREGRWKQLKPNNMKDLRSFLSDDRSDPDWPVWRNRTSKDEGFTSITGIFDLEKRTISAWTSPSNATDAQFEMSLDLANERTSSREAKDFVYA